MSSFIPAPMWVSPQGLTQPQFDELIAILKTEPAWLTGVVYGPQTRVSVAKLREMLPSRYAIRHYPDITHSLRCQYPVPDWDVAYAVTEGREIINPRPLDETTIFRSIAITPSASSPTRKGATTTSTRWSGAGSAGIRRRGRSTRCASTAGTSSAASRGDDFAQGLLALERNWRGPLLTNAGVMTTLKQFQAMEQAAAPALGRTGGFSRLSTGRTTMLINEHG